MREFKESVMLELRQVHDEKNALEQVGTLTSTVTLSESASF
jgi:hypothetical protein